MELRSRSDDRGYVLAVLLIGMAIAAVWAAAALPAWRHQVQRERELELIFRGEQYARAIALYYLKNNRTLPGDMDLLITGHYLRKKWKDPITGEDFVPMLAGGAPAPGGSPTGTPPRGTGPGPAGPTPPQQQGQAPSGIFGVSSKSTASSIIVYQNLQQHSQWAFTYQAYCQKFRVNCNPQQPGGPGGPGGPVRPGDGRGTPPGGGPIRGGGPVPPGAGGPVRPGRGGDVPLPPGGRGPGRGGGGLF